MNLRRAAIAALLLLAAACRDAREDARDQLARLGEAMTAHAKQYGGYPATLDGTRPAGATNLPFKAEHGVTIRLLAASAQGYNVVAVRKSWVCFMVVGPGDQGRIECSPTGSSDRAAAAASGSPLQPAPGVLHSPALLADSADSPARAGEATRRAEP